jgi:UDP-apiose/xylose synthase
VNLDISSRIAIFGGGGFIGSHLAKGLVAHQYSDVICLDVTEEKLQRIVPSEGYEFKYCDVRTDDELVSKVTQESDIVIDLVAYANPITYLERPLEVVELNLFDNLKIADPCARFEKTLIQFSTCEVYGKTGGSTKPFNEDTTDFIIGPVGNHRWIYSCAKQLLERIIHAKGLKHELEYVIIRPFNFIGPEMDYLVQSQADGTPRVFPNFMSSLLYDQPMYLVNRGISQRSFTYIDDAIDAILLILENLDRLKNEIVNIGNPCNEISIRGLAHLMTDLYEQITGNIPNAPIVEVPAQDFYGKGYEDCDRRIPDITKLAKLGWQPQYNLEQTLRKSMRYYCERVTHSA